MTKENSAEIVIVVDRSGSMSPIAKDMCGGFETFLDEQRKLPGECKVTLVQFDNEYEVVYEAKPIADVPSLVLVPRGGTALLDAIGRTIDATGARLETMPEAERPSKVLCMIITDGAENASKEYGRKRVFDMITTQREKFSWEFIFLGANQDSFAAARDIGIPSINVANFVASAGPQARGAMRGLSSNVSGYRSGKGIGSVKDAYITAVKEEEAESEEKSE